MKFLKPKMASKFKTHRFAGELRFQPLCDQSRTHFDYIFGLRNKNLFSLIEHRNPNFQTRWVYKED